MRLARTLAVLAPAVPLALLLAFGSQDPKKTPPPSGPVVGKPAPSFRLNDHAGKAVRVGGAAKTWTVLAFYPKAATPG